MESEVVGPNGSVALVADVSVTNGSETLAYALSVEDETVFEGEREEPLGTQKLDQHLDRLKRLHQRVTEVYDWLDGQFHTALGDEEQVTLSSSPQGNYESSVTATPNDITAKVQHAGEQGVTEHCVDTTNELPRMSVLKDEAYCDSEAPAFVDACSNLYNDYFEIPALEMEWDGTLRPTGEFALELTMRYGDTDLRNDTYSVYDPSDLPTPWTELKEHIETWRPVITDEVPLPAESTVDDGSDIAEIWERDDGSVVRFNLVYAGDWIPALQIKQYGRDVSVSTGDTGDVSSLQAKFERHRERYEELQSSV